MSGKRRKNKTDMTITEQLESFKEYVCDICKYREAMENGSLLHPETTDAKKFLIEQYCENCRLMEI